MRVRRGSYFCGGKLIEDYFYKFIEENNVGECTNE